MHVHVSAGSRQAKIWIEPAIEVAQNHGLRPVQVARALALVRQHEQTIRKAWEARFGR